MKLRQNIKCTECGRRTTCFSDLTELAKLFYLCKKCKETEDES